MHPSSSTESGQQPFSEALWYQALTLAERIPSLIPPHQGAGASREDRLSQATRRLEPWKKQLTVNDPAGFEKRLAMDALTEQDLLLLLAEPVEELQQRMLGQGQPGWIAELQQLWETSISSGGGESLMARQTENAKVAPELTDILIPFVQLGSDWLRQRLGQISETSESLPVNVAHVPALFLPHVLTRLQQAALRTLTLELHIARLQGALAGETPQVRFHAFVEHLCQPEPFYTFLCHYPVLARSLLTITQHWADASAEIVQHLCEDWSDICRTFAGNADPGTLVEVQTDAGDTHRGGHSVAILRFSSGFQLVYKPRSLALDQHFQEMLAWVNTLGLAQPLRPLTIVDKGSHGWVEHVQVHDCSTQEEIRHFYERQGSYLALLYTLEAVDFHYENVLAAGEHPVLVDLEALFHFRLRESDPAMRDPATHFMGYSVMRTGLLPSRRQLKDGGMGIDLSGLGGQEGQVLPQPGLTWKDSGTDQMRLLRERRTLSSTRNRPKLLGQDVSAAEYTAEILNGFTQMYRLLMRHREHWLSVILPRFAHDEIRVVVRATRTYATLLAESFHPKLLGEAFERERLFDHLWGDVPDRPHLHRVIAAERTDLWQGDIPYFTSRPASRDLFTSRGECLKDFLPEAGLQSALRRAMDMDEHDMALQQWMIQASLITTITGDRELRDVSFLPSASGIITSQQLMAAATAIGTRLEALAIRGEHGVNWMGVGVATESEQGTIRQVQPAGLKLYDGLPGIILFLSYLGKLTGQGRFLDLVDTALLTLEEQIAWSTSHRHVPAIGAFSGSGSLIYLFCHLSVLRGDDTWLARAHQLVEEIDPLIEHDTHFDLVFGSAGCIACLLTLYHLTPSERTLQVAIRCGEHLLAKAQQFAGGLRWYTIGPHALTGLSHGTAGIALSLFQLADACKQERFFQAALAALQYERSLFSVERGNWKRTPEQPEHTHSVAWCHGAPGIGLARLAYLPYLDTAQIRQDIQMALATTIKEGFGRNHCLCHGDLGNLEVLLTATQILGTPTYQEELTRLTALIFGGIQEHGWVTGVPFGVETPGLMTGLAGIGYELLRLAAPESVPSVLVLAPPVAERTTSQ